MKVSRAIALLLEEDQDSDVMIQWFTKEHVEANLDKEITTPHWEMAVNVFDNGEVSMDTFEVHHCLNRGFEIIGEE
jgi:hypothetical protein